MNKLNFSGDDAMTEDHLKEIDKYKEFDHDAIAEQYNGLCTNYDEIFSKVGWPDPKRCADFVNELTQEDAKTQISVLDLGCGTGLVGEYLSKMGFQNIDGVDASPGMLRQATNKQVYKNLDELFLGSPDTYPTKYHEKYDFTTASGILADNHLDTSVFEEMLLSLKTGGYAIFSTRVEYLTKYAYGPYMEKLSSSGKWKQVKTASHFKYDQSEEIEGLSRFKKAEVMVYAFQKL